MKLTLVVKAAGKQEGKVLPITQSQFVIGRDPQCHLRPASAMISKRHCAVLVKNDHRFVETMLGALRAGATVTPTTTRAHLSTLTHIMRDSSAKVLFASSDFVEEARKLSETMPSLRRVFVMDQAPA